MSWLIRSGVLREEGEFMNQKGTQAFKADFEKILFQDIHPTIHWFTTTDRDSGWIGQSIRGNDPPERGPADPRGGRKNLRGKGNREKSSQQ
jgi:hypothetical protein